MAYNSISRYINTFMLTNVLTSQFHTRVGRLGLDFATERQRWLISAPDYSLSALLYLHSHHITVWQALKVSFTQISLWKIHNGSVIKFQTLFNFFSFTLWCMASASSLLQSSFLFPQGKLQWNEYINVYINTLGILCVLSANVLGFKCPPSHSFRVRVFSPFQTGCLVSVWAPSRTGSSTRCQFLFWRGCRKFSNNSCCGVRW